MNPFTAGERRQLEAAARDGQPVLCPACGAAVSLSPVPPPETAAYVRRRVLVVCPACRRSAAIDVRAAAPP